MPSATTTSLAGTAGASHLVLWSTNPKIKHHIQQMYFRGSHFVWCSPAFEGAALSRYSVGHSQPPSSDPVSIYRTLHAAVTRGDQGDLKINTLKTSMIARAVQWHEDGVITKDISDEIVAIISDAAMRDWRPLIYVIPFERVAGRLTHVPRKDRASLEPEYQIHDLKDGEFEIIEPWPC